eukprot:6265163-Amphidinium_carterae.2
MRYLHVQQLQSDGELKIHKVSTANNPSDLMTKYLETAKIKKHKVSTWSVAEDNYDLEEATCPEREERRRSQGSDYLSTLKRMRT